MLLPAGLQGGLLRTYDYDYYCWVRRLGFFDESIEDSTPTPPKKAFVSHGQKKGKKEHKSWLDDGKRSLRVREPTICAQSLLG